MPAQQGESFGLQDLTAIAQQWLMAWPTARVWLLDGDLGAGKTTLVQAFCKVLGVEEAVTSPTYSLAHTYDSPQGPIHHLDFYRLDTAQEALDAGLGEYLAGPDYCFVEWASRFPELWPEDAVLIELKVLPDGHRWASPTLTYANL